MFKNLRRWVTMHMVKVWINDNNIQGVLEYLIPYAVHILNGVSTIQRTLFFVLFFKNDAKNLWMFVKFVEWKFISYKVMKMLLNIC